MVVLRMNFSAVHLYDTFAQVKPDAASRLPVHGIFGLSLRLEEAVEYLADIFIGNAASGVADADVKCCLAGSGGRQQGDEQRYASAVGSELDGIAQQVCQHLVHGFLIVGYLWRRYAVITFQRDIPLLGKDLERHYQLVGEFQEIVLRLHYLQLARFHFAEVHQLVDKRQQVFGVALHKVKLFDDLRIVT